LPSSRRTSEQSAIPFNAVFARRNRTSDRCRPPMPTVAQLPKAELRNYLRATLAGPSTGDLAGTALVEAKEVGKLAVALASRVMKVVGIPECEKAIDNKKPSGEDSASGHWRYRCWQAYEWEFAAMPDCEYLSM
jgi:hypothetical protein